MNQHLLFSETGRHRLTEAISAESLRQPPGKPGPALQMKGDRKTERLLHRNSDCIADNGTKHANGEMCHLHVPAKDTRACIHRNRMPLVSGIVLCLIIFLFALVPQKAQAGDVNPSNVFGSVTDLNVKYDANKGYYITVELLVLANADGDGDYMDLGKFFLGGQYAFEIDNLFSDDEAENMKMAIKPYNGFAVFAYPAVQNSSDYSSGYVKSNNSGNVRGSTTASGNVWIRIELYLPQYIITAGNTSMVLQLWDEDGNEKGTKCYIPSQYGMLRLDNLLPVISGTPSTMLDAADGYYDLSYSISKGINKAGAATFSASNFPSVTSSLSANETRGSITTNASIMNSAEENHTADLSLKWEHSLTGITYEASKTGIEIKHIRYPQSIAVSNKNDGTVNISWTTDAFASEKSDDGWRLQYQVGGNSGPWKDMPSGTTVPAVDNSKTAYETLFTIPDAERKQGEQNYYFRVSRKCVNNSAAYKEISLKINTDYKQLTNLLIDEGENNYPRLTWEWTSSGIYSQNVSLKLRIGTTETDITESLNQGAFQTSANEGVSDCLPQRYQLVLKNGNEAAITYTLSDNYVYTPEGKREYESITVSKGYYPDKINIKWTLRNGYDEFTRFRIMRKQLDEADNAWVMVGGDISHTRNTLSYNYDDANINAGIYYQYKIEGIYQCAEEAGSKSSPESVGFSQPFGSVSGRITYAGSSAVKDVSVTLATIDALRSNRELEFLGGPKSYINVPAREKLLNPNGFSFQVWLYNKGTGEQILVDNGSVVIKLDPSNHPVVTLGNNTLAANTAVVRPGEYCHLTVTASQSGSSYNVRIYVNGKLQDDGDLTPSAILSNSSIIKVGGTYTGLMDDIRFWNKALNADEILLNYDRILSGKEPGLVTYYKCDETDKINSDLFDCSAEGTQFNSNHATKGIDATRRDIPAYASHISLKGITDADGIYTITNSVPFTSEGTTYTISPSKGIHKFDPTKRPLYFSPDSRVFNNVDFTDVSSFPVSGTVYFQNSEFPVDSVMIYIDGTPASKDGEPIMTNADGEFTVDVPIGDHYIEMQKDGHVFADNGRFPKDPNKTGTKHNFQERMSDFRFFDQTTVRLMGRVAGGDPQTLLPLGFGLSKANIGKATIQLQAANTVNKLTVSTQDSTYANTIGGKQNAVTFKPYSADVRNIVEIETNPETGEFLAVLPPVPYNLVGVKTKGFEDGAGDQSLDFTYSKMVFNIEPNMKQTAEYTDTLKVKHLFDYHDSLKVTRYNDPFIDVVDKGAKGTAFGDSIYVFTKPDKTTETIKLYTVNPDKTVIYHLGYPVFTQKTSKYTWEAAAYEEYVNEDGDQPVADRVPLAGKTIRINNGLASNQASFEYNEATGEVGDLISMTASESELKLNEEGKQRFSFNAGLPNLSSDHLLAVKITLNQNGKDFVWNNRQAEGHDFRGYLFGQVSGNGSNFITKGPDAVDIVLPDPPGSYSYAYIEKGTTITSTNSSKFTFNVSEMSELTAHLGAQVSTQQGSPVFQVESKYEYILDLGETAGGSQSRGKGNTWETTYTFNERLNTSSDVAFVGSDADVYIGRSNNRTFGMVRQLALYPKADDPEPNPVDPIETENYRLFMKEIVAVGDEFATTFSYTQGHIINTLIPNTIQLRNDLIDYYEGSLPDPGSEAGRTFAAGLTFKDKLGKNVEARYLSNLPKTSANFGTEGSYKFYTKPNSTKTVADEVQAYNNWIAGWEKTIRDNEEAKLALFDNRADLEKDPRKLMYNRSFNAGVNVSESINTEYSYISTKDSTDVVLGSFTLSGGFLYNERAGVTAGFSVGRENTWENTDEDSNSASITFGYELSEDGGDYLRGTNDAITVDIYKPVEDDMKKIIDGGKQSSPIKTLRGFTFRTRAGQTSCPYEPADSAHFAIKDGRKAQLNYGTFIIEKPELYINNTKNATAYNIPTGREATFTIQMQNLSESHNQVTFELSVGDYSNLNGLILSIDGTPLTEPREYVIAYGQELVKTLKVRQSSLDVLNYDNIELSLSSTCDNSEFTSSSAMLSVSYAPSSSPVSLASNSQLVNRHLMETKEGKVTFTISGYDRSFKNFTTIRLQMKRAGEDWPITSIAEWQNDGTLPATLTYDYIFRENEPADDRYVFRALTISMDGVNEIISPSAEITVVKDVRKPEPLGSPSPSNGILNAGGEISVTFNEDVQTGLVTKNNFSLTGILNASKRMEPLTGLAFDGTGRAYTEMPIYTAGSFSIECWIKWPEAAAGTLFSYGEGNQHISLGFDAAGHAVVTIGSETKTSAGTIIVSEAWKYVGLSVNRDNGTVSVYIFEGERQQTMFNSVSFSDKPATEGKLLVGNNPASDHGFHGAAGLLHFYSGNRSLSEMNESKDIVKSGNEPDLIGMWEMEEGEGTVAKDKARSRNLVLNTSWYVYPAGKSLAFNGTSDYAAIPSGTFPFSPFDNFTVEFWFKAPAQGEATMLSIGSDASIGFNAEGKLVLITGSGTQTLATVNLLDDQWHHFALSVKRSGKANAIVDNKATASFASAALFPASVRGSNYYIGARCTETNTYNEYFKGNIDELRVWGSALTTDAVLLDKNRKLRGNEIGLLAYYPFESYQKLDQIYQVYESLNDAVSGSTSVVGNMAATSSVAAPMIDCRPVTGIDFDVVVSDRKIVLNLLEDDYRLEGITLNIRAKEIYDLHNNPADAVSWVAYVNRSALNWQNDKVDLVIAQGEGVTVKASVSNSGGTSANYQISNVPSWLAVSATSGTLQPLASKELTFTVDKNVNIGAYEASLTLTGPTGIQKILPVTLKVTGQRPDWKVNPSDFEQSMTATGQILIEGLPQEDEEDLLAAFMNDTCVGLASPQYEAAYNTNFVYMTIWGNTWNDGQELTFKVWDASTGNVYPVVELSQNSQPLTVKFTANDILGTPDQPILFNALDMIEQSVAIANGWNWISMNVENSTESLLDQFKANASGFATQMKNGAGAYINRAGSAWGGSLTSVSVREGYLVKTSKPATLKIVGKAVKPNAESIELTANKWNWIGYTPQFTLGVADALAGVSNPKAGDQIKGQKGYRIWSANGWVGSLNAMEPGRGYMYKSNSTSNIRFNYPDITPMQLKAAEMQPPLAFNPRWKTDAYRYANTMTVTLAILLDGQVLPAGWVEVAAFSNGECRGNAVIQYVNGFDRPDLGFLMVYGNQEDPIEFRVYDHSSQREYTAAEHFTFLADSIYGTPDKLFALNITEGSGSKLIIYPNPVADDLFIQHGGDVIDKLEINDMSGRSLLLRKGFSEASVNVSRFVPGPYLLKATIKGETSVFKFVKK